jgi:hypothetical protein
VVGGMGGLGYDCRGYGSCRSCELCLCVGELGIVEG